MKRVIETGKIEYGGGTPSGLNTSKIQKFIEKQKKRNAAKTKMQATIEHEKILRVHENLTKLHNFTVNNRLRQQPTGKEYPKHPPSTTHAKRSQERYHAFDNLKSHKKSRERSGPRKSAQQTFALRGPSAERDAELLCNSVPEIERQQRPSRFNSTESRRKSSGGRYKDPGETPNR